MGELDGKAALVTGGGTGIGAAIAEAFAAAGARVAVTGRRPGPLKETAARTGVLAVTADVARLALFVAALPANGPAGQVFSLAGRLL